MINKELILKIFSASYMQRWNDKIRPMQFIEIDKQAHKMFIAFFLGKFEEDKPGFSWTEIIEGGIFELLQRLIITDIKPTLYEKIKSDKEKYKKLNLWIFDQIEPYIGSIENNFFDRYKEYFLYENNNINKRILYAAHLYSSKWEFNFIERANPNGYDIDFIKKDFEEKMETLYDLEGIKQLAWYNSYQKFVDLCGQLRFQSRWANLFRVPQTSVIGHSLIVAIFSYIISMEQGYCQRRLYNNYFTGLFHDLPEVLTRDIISPVKKSIEGLSDLIKDFEKEQMEKIVYPLIPDFFRESIQFFTENEFENIIKDKDKIIRSDYEIDNKYNTDDYSPRDGILLKSIDELSAYLEAFISIENGSKNIEFNNALEILSNKYKKIKKINNYDIYRLFEYFIKK